jgi:hypothetical protein
MPKASRNLDMKLIGSTLEEELHTKDDAKWLSMFLYHVGQ